MHLGRATYRIGLRFVIWTLVVAASILAVDRLSYVYSFDSIQRLVGPKLTFLALILGVGTFQYRLFQDLVFKLAEIINDPRLVDQETRLREAKARTTEPVPALLEWDKQVVEWRKRIDQLRDDHIPRRFIPHNEGIILNVIVLVVALFISVVADAALLVIAPRDFRPARVVSTALFWFVALPFSLIVIRYILVLHSELSVLYQTFSSRGPKGGGR